MFKFTNINPQYFFNVLDEYNFDISVIPEAIELYIKVVDGTYVDHPVLAQNLRSIYGDFPVGHPPDGWKPFYRKTVPPVMEPLLRPKETYKQNKDGSFEDDWHIVELEGDEREKVLAHVKSNYDAYIQYNIGEAQKELTTASSDEDINIWTTYINYLESIKNDNPFEVNVMPHPRKDVNGNWVTLENDGEPPNVI